MRAPVVVFGVALLVLGAVAWFVPLDSSSSNQQVPVGHGYKFGLVGPLLLGAIPFTASWTSSSQDAVIVYSCDTNAACPNFTHDAVKAHGSGAKGSMAWSGRAGLYYLLVPTVDSNVTVTYVDPIAGGIVGVAVLGAGVLALAAGVLMRGKPRSRSTAAASK